MNVGIEVLNDSNTVQLTDKYSNLRLVTKGVLPVGKHTVKTVGTSPLIVLRLEQTEISAPVSCFVEGAKKIGTEWFFYISTTLGAISKPDIKFEYYIFDQSPPADSGYGLQAFSGDRVLRYDSNANYMKILQEVKNADFRKVGTIPAPTGKKIGLLFCVYPLIMDRYFMQQGFTCFQQLYTAGMNNNPSGGIRIGQTWCFSAATSGYCDAYSSYDTEFSCVVVDLTGM